MQCISLGVIHFQGGLKDLSKIAASLVQAAANFKKLNQHNTYLHSLNNSPCVACAISSSGASACISNATLHTSRMNELSNVKSHSGGKEIFGFTFIARITSCIVLNRFCVKYLVRCNRCNVCLPLWYFVII